MGVYGSSLRRLGLLVGLMGRVEEAAQRFEDALALNARMQARPWLAWTQADYGALLIERGQGGDAVMNGNTLTPSC